MLLSTGLGDRSYVLLAYTRHYYVLSRWLALCEFMSLFTNKGFKSYNVALLPIHTLLFGGIKEF